MSHAQLRASLTKAGFPRPGLISAPGDPGWDEARGGYNLAADPRPDCVAHPADITEVRAVVLAAGEAGLRVAVQRTGHGSGPRGPLEGAVLVRTDALDEVRVDPATRTARIGAGALWGQVGEATAPHGLWPLSGSSPTVGAAGFLLGGGLPMLGREFGVGANRVRAVELVTPGGEMVRADADTERDLFWAVRGAGGNFGVVTALEIELLTLTEAHGGFLFFPLERAAEVLGTWLEVMRDAPDRLTVIARFLRVPDVPGVPEVLAGRAFAVAEVVSTAAAEEVDPLIAPLRALGPELDMVRPIPAAGLARLHMDPEDPMPFASEHVNTGPLGPDAVDALVEAAGAHSGSGLVSVELRPLGGAFAHAPVDGGAVAAIPGAFTLFAVGIAAGPTATTLGADLAAVRSAMAPYAVGHAPTFAEEALPADVLFGAGTATRLRAVRERWDPHGVMLAGHRI